MSFADPPAYTACGLPQHRCARQSGAAPLLPHPVRLRPASRPSRAFPPSRAGRLPPVPALSCLRPAGGGLPVHAGLRFNLFYRFSRWLRIFT